MNDSSTYTLLAKDPSKKIEKDANDVLTLIGCDALDIPDTQFSHLISRHSKAPALKCLMKDHKEEFPHCKVRPLQPISGSAIAHLDLIVSHILGQCRKFHNFSVSNSTTLRKKIQGLLPLPPNTFQFVMDVENMYPSLPTDQTAIDTVHTHLKKYACEIDMMGLKTKHVIEMLKFTLENIILRVNDEYYKQDKGVGTGYYSSCAYAGVIIQDTLEQSIDDDTPLTSLSIYVDDGYGLWHGTLEQLKLLISKINSIWPNVKFILEEEDENNSVVFLDLRITRTESALKTTFYRKDTHSGTYLHYKSHGPIIHKINIVKNETRRVIDNCSDPMDAEPHLKILSDNLERCGYPLNFIQKHMLIARSPPSKTTHEQDPNTPILSIPFISEAFTRIVRKEISKADINARVVVKAQPNLKRCFHKPPSVPCNCDICKLGIPCKIRHVVYNAECNACHQKYIGVTTRPFEERVKEHAAQIDRQNKKSALTEHLLECEDNLEKTIKGFSWSILDRGENWKDSFMREATHIRHLNPKINRNMSGWILP